MTLAPALGPVGGTRPRLVTAVRGTDGTTIHDRPRPINLVTASEPIQQREVDQIPHARPLPIAQAGASTSSPTRTRAPAGASAREYRCEGRRQCLRGTRAPRRAAAHPVAVGGGIGKNGSTRSHNGSGSSVAAMRVHATSPTTDQVLEVLLHALSGAYGRRVSAEHGHASFRRSATRGGDELAKAALF